MTSILNIPDPLAPTSPDPLCAESLTINMSNNTKLKRLALLYSIELATYVLAPNHQSALRYLLLHTGCRVSEALGLTFKDVHPAGYIYLRGLKKSKSQLVHEPGVTRIINPKGHVSDELIWHYTYGQVNLYMTPLARSWEQPKGGKRNTITHIYRYGRVAWMRYCLGLTDKEIQAELGHNALSSTEHYLRRLEDGEANCRNPRPGTR